MPSNHRDFKSDNDLPDESHRRPNPPLPAARMASEIAPAQLRWLWPQRLPYAAVTLLVGDPGVGKSLLTAEFAARITRGDSWPVSPGAPLQPAHYLGSGCVVHAATQDSVESVVLSRLSAAGARLSQVLLLDGASVNSAHVAWAERLIRNGWTSRTDIVPEPVTRPLRLPDDEATLEISLRELNQVHCLILDPITDYVSPGVSITELFRSLTAVARRRNVVVLATAHLSKTPAHRPIYRVRGSLEYVSAARSVLLLTTDSHDPTRRILHQIKSSYGPLAAPLAFHIQSVSPPSIPSSSVPPSVPSLIWDENPVPTLPPHLLDLSLERQSVLRDASSWLLMILSSGPRPTREIRADAARIGIANGTLYRAKALLRIPANKPSINDPWSWSLPDSPKNG